MTQNVHIRVRFEQRSYWATVEEYPGVFATGDSIEELRASLEEGLSLVIRGADPEQRPVQLSPLHSGGDAEAAEMVIRSELTLA
ncbi:MAG TPA: type II toxin-antitoxin system HicB family antitoxin [Solirubrobacteraceae bacterium]|jgi:predicted RNase H-like HicB family nuclease|nr:type II toxin-antitoxin system HicB family antitoxin [Solirubrobacteraceae bacterium]